MLSSNEQFKKMNEEFKKTIDSLSRDIGSEVAKLKDKLKAKQTQDTLAPFTKFAAAIASLDADHIITEAGGVQLRAIDFKMLAQLINE